MPEVAHFSVTYDGEPLQAGAMDVHDLAPALLGLADVVDEINNVVTGGQATVRLRVRTGFRRGSFVIDLEIIQTAYKRFVDLFSSPDVIAIAAFLALLGLSGLTGLIQLVRRSRGKKPHSVVEIEHTNRVRVTFEGDDPVDVDQKVWRLFNSSRARVGLARLVRPLKREGMDKLTLRQPDQDPVVIPAQESEAFVPPEEHEGELVTESERVLRIIGISFKEGNKWRVSEGGNGYFVSIADAEFVQKVQDGLEKFGANDLLRVILRTRQWYEGNDLKASHEIVRILEHIERGPPPEQLNIGSSDEPA